VNIPEMIATEAGEETSEKIAHLKSHQHPNHILSYIEKYIILLISSF
jgi:hypothetical protein